MKAVSTTSHLSRFEQIGSLPTKCPLVQLRSWFQGADFRIGNLLSFESRNILILKNNVLVSVIIIIQRQYRGGVYGAKSYWEMYEHFIFSRFFIFSSRFAVMKHRNNHETVTHFSCLFPIYIIREKKPGRGSARQFGSFFFNICYHMSIYYLKIYKLLFIVS
jgi:hypothetical protein